MACGYTACDKRNTVNYCDESVICSNCGNIRSDGHKSEDIKDIRKVEVNQTADVQPLFQSNFKKSDKICRCKETCKEWFLSFLGFGSSLPDCCKDQPVTAWDSGEKARAALGNTLLGAPNSATAEATSPYVKRSSKVNLVERSTNPKVAPVVTPVVAIQVHHPAEVSEHKPEREKTIDHRQSTQEKHDKHLSVGDNLSTKPDKRGRIKIIAKGGSATSTKSSRSARSSKVSRASKASRSSKSSKSTTKTNDTPADIEAKLQSKFESFDRHIANTSGGSVPSLTSSAENLIEALKRRSKLQSKAPEFFNPFQRRLRTCRCPRLDNLKSFYCPQLLCVPSSRPRSKVRIEITQDEAACDNTSLPAPAPHVNKKAKTEQPVQNKCSKQPDKERQSLITCPRQKDCELIFSDNYCKQSDKERQPLTTCPKQKDCETQFSDKYCKQSDNKEHSQSKGSKQPDKEQTSQSRGSKQPDKEQTSQSRGSKQPDKEQTSQSRGSKQPDKEQTSQSRGSKQPDKEQTSQSRGSKQPDKSPQASVKGSRRPSGKPEKTTEVTESTSMPCTSCFGPFNAPMRFCKCEPEVHCGGPKLPCRSNSFHSTLLRSPSPLAVVMPHMSPCCRPCVISTGRPRCRRFRCPSLTMCPNKRSRSCSRTCPCGGNSPFCSSNATCKSRGQQRSPGPCVTRKCVCDVCPYGTKPLRCLCPPCCTKPCCMPCPRQFTVFPYCQRVDATAKRYLSIPPCKMQTACPCPSGGPCNCPKPKKYPLPCCNFSPSPTCRNACSTPNAISYIKAKQNDAICKRLLSTYGFSPAAGSQCGPASCYGNTSEGICPTSSCTRTYSCSGGGGCKSCHPSNTVYNPTSTPGSNHAVPSAHSVPS